MAPAPSRTRTAQRTNIDKGPPVRDNQASTPSRAGPSRAMQWARVESAACAQGAVGGADGEAHSRRACTHGHTRERAKEGRRDTRSLRAANADAPVTGASWATSTNASLSTPCSVTNCRAVRPANNGFTPGHAAELTSPVKRKGVPSG